MTATRERLTVGVLSDTHGLLRPEAIEALRACDLIIHAGDVGAAHVLAGLRNVAPTFAVRGNNDRGPWAERLATSEVVEAGFHLVYVIHEFTALDIDPAAAGFSVVVTGHSHQPHVEQREGVFYLNPGSAGPRRFKLPVAVAKLHIDGPRIEPEILELALRS